jgi:hypothetical protein
LPRRGASWGGGAALSDGKYNENRNGTPHNTTLLLGMLLLINGSGRNSGRRKTTKPASRINENSTALRERKQREMGLTT